MIIHVIQSLILLAIAFLLGVILGRLLHWWRFRGHDTAAVSASGASLAGGVGAAGLSAADSAKASGDSRSASAGLDSSGVSIASDATGSVDSSAARGGSVSKPSSVDSDGESDSANGASSGTKAGRNAVGASDGSGSASQADGISSDADDNPSAFQANSASGNTANGGLAHTGAEDGLSNSNASASPTTPDGADDLKRISGIGPLNESRLHALNITTFAQIAAWSPAEQAEFGEKLSFPGRVEREKWVSQAIILSQGGKTNFSTRVDAGDVYS